MVKIPVNLGRLASLVALAGGCGSPSGWPPDGSRLERSISTALAQRWGIKVITRCPPLVPACRAELPDGSSVPIFVRGAEWQVIGMVVVSDVIEGYLRAELADLGAAQAVSCGARIQPVDADPDADAQITCALGAGGKAFVTVHRDGTFAVELELERAAANARSAPVPGDLVRASRALDTAEVPATEDDDDDHPR